jgi:hypothetical protein
LSTPFLNGLAIPSLTTGSVLFVGASGVLSQDNAGLFYDDSNNRLGVGINSSLAGILHVAGVTGGAFTDVTGASAIVGSVITLTPTNQNPTGGFRGLHVEAKFDYASNPSGATYNAACVFASGVPTGNTTASLSSLVVYGGRAWAAHGGTGMLGAAVGLQSWGRNLGAGTVTTMRAIDAQVRNESTGTVSAGTGIYVAGPMGTSGGTFGIVYGLYIAAQTPSAGTLTTSPPYAIYQSDSTDRSYFAGPVTFASTLTAKTGGSATFLVAANNASARVKAQADYVCDGTADEVEINAAIAALPATGGMVRLSEGDFTIAAPINLTAHNVTFAGSGMGHPYGGLTVAGGTLLRIATGFVGSYGILAWESVSATRVLSSCHLRDFTLYGADRLNASSGAITGIFYEAARSSVRGVRVSDMSGSGLIMSGNASFSYPNGAYDNIIDGCKFESCGVDGVQFTSYSTDNFFSNTICAANGRHGVYLDANSAVNTFTGCYFYDNRDDYAVYCVSSFGQHFTGCRFTSCSGGLYLGGSDGANFTVVGNEFRDCSDGGDDLTDGIYIDMSSAAYGGLISGNTFQTLGGGYTNPNGYRMRYCINIASTNMIGLVLGANGPGFRPTATGSFATAALYDGGTDTLGGFYGSGQGDAPLSSWSVPFTDGDTTRRVRVYDGRVRAGSTVGLSVRRPNDSSTDFDVTATFERGIQGDTIAAVTEGSLSAWDEVITSTVSSVTYPIYDGAHVLRISGTLAGMYQTSSGRAMTSWKTATLGATAEHYGRLYLYLGAAPPSSVWFVSGYDSASSAFVLVLNSSRQIVVRDSAGVQGTMTTAIPLNQFVRVEWHVINSATVGQVEVKLFKQPFSATADETLTTAASLNTRTQTDQIDFGIATSSTTGPWWFDDLAISFSGYPGPSQSPPDSNDLGYVYSTSVVRIGDGYFDVLVSVTDGGFEDTTEVPPNETVELIYSIGS